MVRDRGVLLWKSTRRDVCSQIEASRHLSFGNIIGNNSFG